jgi:gentisate 1,2-dioxygenase
MRETVPGRADVEDSPELDEYYRALQRESSYALWNVANSIEPWFPKSQSRPALWRYSVMRPLVLRALDLVSAQKAGRRVVALENPAREGTSACVGWLYTGLQGMRPGEQTSAHRHAASALRFVMEGRGAYTVVDGHRVTLSAGDFVITPANCWHDHGVESDGEISVWQDGLDMLLVNQLEANFYEVHPELVQRTAHPVNDSPHLFGGPGLLPGGLRWSASHSPLLKYEWGPTYESLLKASRSSAGSPFDGTILQYVSPASGGPLMPTLAAHIQLLQPQQRTLAHRHTGSVVYNVAKGKGCSVIDGQRLEWSERDIFVVPSWSAHEHANLTAAEDAVLFSFSDLPVLHALGLYREEAVAQ